MKRHSFLCIFSPLILVSQASLADITVYENDLSELEAYGKLKAVLHYQQHRSPATKLKDDSSRAGLKGKYDLTPDLSLRALVEVGSHINHSNKEDVLSLRLARIGAKTDLGQIAWGKQEALIHNLDNYDFTNKLGGVAHYTRDEMNNKRNESTFSYRLDWQDFRVEAQLNGNRDLDKRARLRAGGESFKVNEREIENGLGLGVRYKRDAHNVQVRVASQITHYQQDAKAISVATTGVKTGKLGEGNLWRLGATLGHYTLKDSRASASAYTLGVSGKVQLFSPVHAYLTVETIRGTNDLSAGFENALTAGAEYRITQDAKVYTEAQQSWFDRSKEDRSQWVLGGIYEF
ncbi:porin [Vibrio nereis]|uniref:Uncharacterized protein n=1 Tax=Vibrio nereis TaxID=693 RepID=A0A0M0HJX5_VIBNE|nr:porin [Vibrio nereis]KOO02336.1 hypothetical protein AKJ17_14760 [Vibrio nereis]